ncbi:MAG: F0F1 ATP synthase subunit A [Acidobacteriota bacterium]|jgi:F-type H+-transporting ATPase subunit a
MASPEAAEAAEAAEHHVHSIVYGPVNAVWDWFIHVSGLDSVSWVSAEVPEHVAMSLFVMVLCAALFIPMRFMLDRDRPGKLQQMLELLVEGLESLLEDVVGHGAARRYLPIIGAFTVFILFANLSGLFFFLQPPTQNPNTTFALSITAFLYYNFSGLRRHGLSYFKQFLGPVAAMFLLFLPIEIISHLARALSLGLRLFGNIFGEHAVSAEFFGIAPIVLPIPVMLLGLFAAMLQTFIFIMLTMVYLAGAEASEH